MRAHSAPPDVSSVIISTSTAASMTIAMLLDCRRKTVIRVGMPFCVNCAGLNIAIVNCAERPEKFSVNCDWLIFLM